MALIKYGSTVAMIAGSIGGSTYARNRYGAYIRNRTKPIDPGSNLQTEFRTRVSAAVAAWQALSATQRTGFNEKAKTTVLTNRIGESFHPSGINLFIRTYNLLDLAGLAQVTTPPTSPIIADGDAHIDYVPASGLEHHTTLADWPAGATMLVWRAINKTNSTYFFKGPYAGVYALLAAGYPGGESVIVGDAGLDVDSSMFLMWRLVGTDGAASHPRRQRDYKPPA